MWLYNLASLKDITNWQNKAQLHHSESGTRLWTEHYSIKAQVDKSSLVNNQKPRRLKDLSNIFVLETTTSGRGELMYCMKCHLLEDGFLKHSLWVPDKWHQQTKWEGKHGGFPKHMATLRTFDLVTDL